jgi:hypothetical protein
MFLRRFSGVGDPKVRRWKIRTAGFGFFGEAEERTSDAHWSSSERFQKKAQVRRDRPTDGIIALPAALSEPESSRTPTLYRNKPPGPRNQNLFPFDRFRHAVADVSIRPIAID